MNLAMLARGEEEVMAAMAFFGFCLTVAVLFYRNHTRRIRVLENVLQGGNLDDTSKQMLVAELTRPSVVVHAILAIWNQGRLLAGIGWIGIFLGIGMLFSGERDAIRIGVPLACVSFGVLTLPFAFRELDRRAPTAGPQARP